MGGANFQTVVRVERTTRHCKTKAESAEVAYDLFEALVKDTSDNEGFSPVRGHGRRETSNAVRDVTLKEEGLKTKEPIRSKVRACCRSVTLNLLQKLNRKNGKAKPDAFADDFPLLIYCLAEMNVL